jgi:phosphoserine phosphatase RsbU/P
MAGHSPPPLLRTWPGRAIAAGVVIKLLIATLRAGGVPIPAFAGLADVAAGIAIAAGAVYFLVRLFVLAKRRLLWRVRRKLILSYVFIGFVPAILIATFFVLGALLLFFNFSSYLVQAEIQSLDDRVRLLATAAALEIQQNGSSDAAAILARTLGTARAEFPTASGAVVPVERSCAPQGPSPAERGRTTQLRSRASAGPWQHAEPPASLPAWIGCDGFAGVIAYSRRDQSADAIEMVVRGVVFPPSPMPAYGVVIDLPVDDATKNRLRRESGVDVRGVTAVDVGAAQPLPGRAGSDRSPDAAASTPAAMPSGPLSWVTFINYTDWTSGDAGTLLVSTQLNIQEIYGHISNAQGLVGDRPFGQALLLVLLVVVGGLFLIIEVVALVVGLALARSITGSVHELFTGTERVRHGDFSHKIAITANDQLGELAGSFNSMTASIEGLLREAAEKKRLEEELRIAHEIQMSLLPQGPLSTPGLSAAAMCIPAREVGGDYYDFLPLDDGRVGILIADVAGKGTSAALYMAQLKGLVLSLSAIHRSPRDLLIVANRIIAQHLDSRTFITITYAIVDVRARTMVYARAGHTPLIHVPAANGGLRRARILAPSGMVVGLNIDDEGRMFERLLEEETLALHTGELYVLFTDGISEAMNETDECFGETRLGGLLEDHADLPSEELRERVLREVQTFVGGAPQHDDMTMILLKIEDLPQVAAVASRSSELAGLARPN